METSSPDEVRRVEALKRQLRETSRKRGRTKKTTHNGARTSGAKHTPKAECSYVRGDEDADEDEVRGVWNGGTSRTARDDAIAAHRFVRVPTARKFDFDHVEAFLDVRWSAHTPHTPEVLVAWTIGVVDRRWFDETKDAYAAKTLAEIAKAKGWNERKRRAHARAPTAPTATTAPTAASRPEKSKRGGAGADSDRDGECDGEENGDRDCGRKRKRERDAEKKNERKTTNPFEEDETRARCGNWGPRTAASCALSPTAGRLCGHMI